MLGCASFLKKLKKKVVLYERFWLAVSCHFCRGILQRHPAHLEGRTILKKTDAVLGSGGKKKLFRNGKTHHW
jgi:hypothetical protein